MTQSLNKSSYAQFFLSLAEVESTYLLPNPHLAPHARYYVREMRIKAYTQLLESYKTLTLERMCRSFGVSEAFMDRDLSRFIASGRLSCTIDKVSGVVTTNKAQGQNKTGLYEQVVKQGDLLLSGESLADIGCGVVLMTQIFRSCIGWLARVRRECSMHHSIGRIRMSTEISREFKSGSDVLAPNFQHQRSQRPLLIQLLPTTHVCFPLWPSIKRREL